MINEVGHYNNARGMNGDIREAVGVFMDRDALDAAVAELENTAFPRQDISVMAGPHKLERMYGTQTINPEKLEDSPEAPRTILVRPEERTIALSAFIGASIYTGGVVCAIEFGAGTTSGMLLGFLGGAIITGLGASLIAWLYNQHSVEKTQKQISKGGLLLWVRTPGPAREEKAKKIMLKYGARDVHIHDVH